MTESEFLAGESNTLEYKRQISSDHTKFLKTIVAFANCKGGTLVFGIDDETHDVIGIDSENIFREVDLISNAIYDSCTPTIPCEVNLQTLLNKTVIVVTVYQGQHSPYYIKSLGLENGCFIRSSATTRVVDEITLRSLMFEGSTTGFDQTIQNGKTVTEEEINLLCKSLKETALVNCFSDDEKREIRDVTKNTLLSWNLIYEKENNYFCTNGFDLLFNNSIWSAKIQCGVFSGTDRTSFIDKREYSGSIQSQVKEAYDFVLRNIHRGVEIEGLFRREIFEIPPTAIRELIINAVVHRNYLEPAHIQIAIFDDRIEFTSPGGFLRGVTKERIKEGFSKIRNQGLANAFHYMHLVEQWGTGIPRIEKLLKEANCPNIEVLDMEDALRFILYKPNKNGDKTAINKENGDKTAINKENGDKTAIKDAKTMILEYLQEHGESTGKEISLMLGLKASRTKVYLNELEDLGKIITHGANKNRTYLLKENK